MRKRLYFLECFSAFYVIGVELKVKADNFRKLLVFYWIAQNRVHVQCFMRKRLYFLECFSAFYVIGVELKVKADNFRKLLVFYWDSFLENVIILAYYFIYCLLCKFFDRKIVCRMGEIFMMSKEQFLVFCDLVFCDFIAGKRGY